MTKLYYLQDTRTICGNDIMWWAKEGKGYTTDLSKAEIWEETKVRRQQKVRDTDLPWPKEYIDKHTRPAVDFQYVNHKEAIKSVE